MCLLRLSSSLNLILFFVHLSLGHDRSLFINGDYVSFVSVFSLHPSENTVPVNDPLFEWTNS